MKTLKIRQHLQAQRAANSDTKVNPSSLLASHLPLPRPSLPHPRLPLPAFPVTHSPPLALSLTPPLPSPLETTAKWKRKGTSREAEAMPNTYLHEEWTGVGMRYEHV